MYCWCSVQNDDAFYFYVHIEFDITCFRGVNLSFKLHFCCFLLFQISVDYASKYSQLSPHHTVYLEDAIVELPKTEESRFWILRHRQTEEMLVGQIS